MKKYILHTVFVVAALLCTSIPSHAYITLTPSSYTAKVGETIDLPVPNAQAGGYIDHAVWACSNPNIHFITKDEFGATIEILQGFEGVAVVQLICVEKYLTYGNDVRAITYYKEFKISCSAENQVALKSFTFPKITLKVGDFVAVKPTLTPSNATITLTSVTLSAYEQHYNTSSIFIRDNTVYVFAKTPGTSTATIKASNGKTAEIEVEVTKPEVYSGITDESGNTVYDSNLFNATKKMKEFLLNILETKN